MMVQASINVIGWRWRDGIKQLLFDNGFTMQPGEGQESYDKFIDLLTKECKEKGEEFPEFYWNGYKWQPKETQKNQAL